MEQARGEVSDSRSDKDLKVRARLWPAKQHGCIIF